MLTKNFYSFMRAPLQKTTATFTLTDGTTYSNKYVSNYDVPFTAISKWAGATTTAGVSFGTGNTPATVSDYSIESILTSTEIGVTVPSGVSFSQFDTYEEYSVTFGVTNKTAEAITIKEVGLISNTYVGNYYALVDRTVLDTPVTIPAGQSKQITYTIRFNY